MAETTSVRCSASRWAWEPPKRARIVRTGTQSGDDVGVPTLGVRDDRTGGGQADLGGHADVRGRSRGGDVGREPIDDGAGVVEAVRADQRHHRVQVVEHVPGFADARVAHASASGAKRPPVSMPSR